MPNIIVVQTLLLWRYHRYHWQNKEQLWKDILGSKDCDNNLDVCNLLHIWAPLESRVDATNNGQCQRWREGYSEQLPNMTFTDMHPTLSFFHPNLSLPIPYIEINSDDNMQLEDQKQESNQQHPTIDWDIVKSSGPIIADMKSNGQHAVWLCWSLPPTYSLYMGKRLPLS